MAMICRMQNERSLKDQLESLRDETLLSKCQKRDVKKKKQEKEVNKCNSNNNNNKRIRLVLEENKVYIIYKECQSPSRHRS